MTRRQSQRTGKKKCTTVVVALFYHTCVHVFVTPCFGTQGELWRGPHVDFVRFISFNFSSNQIRRPPIFPPSSRCFPAIFSLYVPLSPIVCTLPPLSTGKVAGSRVLMRRGAYNQMKSHMR